jgi:hypothetical protein
VTIGHDLYRGLIFSKRVRKCCLMYAAPNEIMFTVFTSVLVCVPGDLDVVKTLMISDREEEGGVIAR